MAEGPRVVNITPENWPEYVNKVTITPDEDILREIRGSKKDTQVLQVIVQRSTQKPLLRLKDFQTSGDF